MAIRATAIVDLRVSHRSPLVWVLRRNASLLDDIRGVENPGFVGAAVRRIPLIHVTARIPFPKLSPNVPGFARLNGSRFVTIRVLATVALRLGVGGVEGPPAENVALRA